MSRVSLGMAVRSLYCNDFLRSGLTRSARPAMYAALLSAALLFWPGPAANVHGQTLVQSNSGGSGSFSTTLTVAFGAEPTTGHLLVVVLGIRNAAADGVATVSLTTGGPWTAAPFNTVTSPGLQMYYKAASAVAEISITATADTSTRMAMAIYDFSGVSTTLDKSNTQFLAITSGNAAATTTATSVIPTKAPNLVIVGGVIHTGITTGTAGSWTTFTNPTWTETNDVASQGSNGRVDLDAAYKINASLGTVSTQNTYTPIGATEPWSTGWRTGMISFNSSTPAAADGVVRGTITDSAGMPVSGAVVRLSGTQSRKTITDANGNYRFDNVETTGFYTVTPSRANYSFGPAQRSFGQFGNQTEAAFTGTPTGDVANPLDTAEYFVRQEYVDILGREPDENGFNYWSDRILECGDDATCIRARRIDVAAAFFIEQEFRQTGSFIYDVYKGALGRRPVFSEFAADRQQVVGGASLDAQQSAFVANFVQRAEFVQRYQANTSADSFVDALIQNLRQTSGVDLSGQRDSLINSYNTGASLNESRGLVVRAIADNAAFNQANHNAAFVLTEYFGYLRRDPDQGGYDFWLNVLNNGEPGNYRGMVCSFITSREYQQRFSSVVTHGNGECGQ